MNSSSHPSQSVLPISIFDIRVGDYVIVAGFERLESIVESYHGLDQAALHAVAGKAKKNQSL